MKIVILLAPCLNKTSLPRAVPGSELIQTLSTPTTFYSILPTWTTTGSVIKHSCSKRKQLQFTIYRFSSMYRQIRDNRMKIAMIPYQRATSYLMISMIAAQSLLVMDSGLPIPKSSQNLKVMSQLPIMTLAYFRMSANLNRFQRLMQSCRCIAIPP